MELKLYTITLDTVNPHDEYFRLITARHGIAMEVVEHHEGIDVVRFVSLTRAALVELFKECFDDGSGDELEDQIKTYGAGGGIKEELTFTI